MALKIYTRTGDKGRTSLIGGTKVPKDHPRIAAYGELDELNSQIGLVGSRQNEGPVLDLLRSIQDRLFTIGSALACDPGKEIKMNLPELRQEDIQILEKAIDHISGKVPPLTAFILPGGSAAVCTCHIARCVCRRAERACVALAGQGEFVGPLVIPYLNRLSDYLFMLARLTSHLEGKEEIVWKPRL